MKPEILKLFNIGPFVGEHTINFFDLEDFFLISGKTGSGKTTILDSITYVLYGTLPGARKNVETKNLRTHFCNEQDLSYVDFTFSINTKIYRIKRTLPYTYTTRNNTTRKEGEAIELYSLNSIYDIEGDLICNQKSETDKKIKDLVKLNVEEFSKIVLLPQGEFATFLRQSTTERKTMLSKLFPVENFTKITEHVKEEKTKLKIQHEQILNQIKFIENDFDINLFEEQIKELTTTHKFNKNEIATNQDRLYEIAGTMEKIQNEISTIEEYENLKNELEKLLLNQEKIETLKIKISKAKKALELFPIIKNLEQKEKQITETQNELTLCKNKIQELSDKEQNFLNEENSIIQTEEEIKKLEIKKNELEQSFSTLTTLKENKNNLETVNVKIKTKSKEQDNLKEKIQQIKNFIEENKNKIEEKESLLNDILILNKNLETSINNKKYFEETEKDKLNKTQEETLKLQFEKQKLLIEDLKQEIENEKLNELAHTLACNLKENSPCPVCGSTNHPNLAQKKSNNISKQENLILQETLLKETETKYLEIQKIRNISEGTILNLKDKIDLSIKLSPEEITNSINAKTDSINQIKELEKNLESKKITLEELETDYNKSIENINILLQDKKIFNDRIKTIEENLIKNFSFTEIELSNILEIENKLKQEVSVTNNKIEKSNLIVKNFYEEQKQNTINLSTQKEKEAILNSNLIKCKKEFENENLILNEKISKTNFSDIEEIKINYLEEEQIIYFEKETEQWTKEKEKLETLINEKQNSVSTNKETLTEKFKKYEQTKNELKQKISDLTNYNSRITEKISELNKSKENFDKNEKQRKEISEKLSNYEKLHKVLSGDNPKKIDITSWILEMYLQEIIEFANKRLNKISDGRYVMIVNTEKESNRGAKGLDIDIYDAYTGKSRPCNTLSGGETFMASISLALAISDTVQSRKGGIQLDSLFIDEGFGSLDENSLEQAISILDEIRDSRKIGIISHVGDLKSRIKSSIEIEKTQSGSKIILI
jgi:exonuclease SbcC